MPKYATIDTIPAKVFFNVLKTKDYQQLKPKPKETGLAETFISIYDDFFIKSDNEESKEYLRLYKEISILEYKINSLNQALHFYYHNKTTKEMRQEFIKALKDGYNITINEDAPFADEVLRVLTIEKGILQNDLSLYKIDFENYSKSSTGKQFDYYDRIGDLSNVLESNSLLKEDMTLAVYVSLEKLAKKKIEQHKKRNGK